MASRKLKQAEEVESNSVTSEAKKTRKSHKITKSGEGDGAENIFRAAVSLMHFEVTRNPGPADEDKSAKKNVISVRAHLIDFEENAFLCTFSAGIQFDGKYVLQITASYVVAINDYVLAGGKKEEVIKAVVKNSAWGRFSDLFSIVNSQVGSRLPPLPFILKNDKIIFGDTLKSEGV